MPNTIDFRDLVPDHIDRVEMSDGTSWYRDDVVCGCGEDSGLRLDNPWRDDKETYCDACGTEVRYFDGTPASGAIVDGR